MQHFTPKQVQDYLQTASDKPVLLDVREPWEYEICHIEGSLLIPMGQIPLKMQQLDKSKTIIVICHHGIRSRQAGMYLSHYGFHNIINLDGGMEAWAQDVEPTMQRY